MAHTSLPCDSCHAGCCRAFAVPITGADVLRLERSTGLSFWDFACRWEDKAGIIAGDYAPHLHFDDEPATPFTLCLLHAPSLQFPTATKCSFLVETPVTDGTMAGVGQCGVYEHRPSACRAFPLRLDTSSPLAILNDIPANGRPEEGNPAYDLCPRPWLPDDIDPIQAPQDLAVAQYEATFFRQVAALWNERPSSWLKFPEFLHLVYERRIVMPADVAAVPVEHDAPAILPFPTSGQRPRRAA